MAFERMVDGHVIRYNDLVICALSEEDRLALIDLSTGLGRLLGLFAPDDVTFSCLVGRRYAAKGGAVKSLPYDHRYCLAIAMSDGRR
jgi:homoaconitase/3-isopropylmalate dehydratase large subunit